MTPMQAGEDRRALALAGAGVEVRSDGPGGAQRFHGHAAVFDTRTAIGDPFTWGFYEQIARGCFTDTIAQDDQRFLIDHDPYYVVSRASAGTLTRAQDARGLAVDSALDTRLSYVSDLVTNVDIRNITGMSFGFHATADEWRTEQERRDGRLVDVQVRTLLAARVPEVSAVTFPAYEASDAGVRAEDPVRAVGLALRSRPDAAALFEARSRHCPELSAYFERESIRVEQRKAIGTHSTDTDTSSWDGPAQEKNLADDATEETYKQVYAWQDPDKDADTQAAYKFPHHFVDSDGTPGAASTKGCEAGIAVLNGGRGGSGIPDADRQGVYDHLAAHLRDADIDPPPLRDPEDDDDDDEQDAVALGDRRLRRLRADASRGPGYTIRRRGERRDDDETEGTSAEILIYDYIGFFGVDAEQFVRDLAALDADNITLRLNSPGGSVYDGIAMMNALHAHPARVTAVVEGLAASAASFIAMAGERVEMWRNAEMMIHEAWGLCLGDAVDMHAMGDRLDAIGNNIASIYARRAGGETSDWREVMLAETWFSAQEAVDAGLADVVREPAAPASDEDERARRRFDLSEFRYAGRAAAPPPAPARTGRRNRPTHRELARRRLDVRRPLAASPGA